MGSGDEVAVEGENPAHLFLNWLDGRNEEILTGSDTCALCAGKLLEGFTELVLKAGDGVVVIKRVPALVCSCCGEAYLMPEVSEKIDQVLKEYQAGKLLARTIAAGEIELEMSA